MFKDTDQAVPERACHRRHRAACILGVCVLLLIWGPSKIRSPRPIEEDYFAYLTTGLLSFSLFLFPH